MTTLPQQKIVSALIVAKRLRRKRSEAHTILQLAANKNLQNKNSCSGTSPQISKLEESNSAIGLSKAEYNHNSIEDQLY